jgi:hypothetical protein
MDLFRREDDDSMSSRIYIRRSLPIECNACGVRLDSYPAHIVRDGVTGRTWTTLMVEEFQKSL